MPPLDPALGLSTTLTSLQQQQQQRQPVDTGAGDLARAARSLESVQGGVSGQTSAIQQLMMAGQQQTLNLQMTINQLGNQISQLSRALGQTAAVAPQPMPMTQPMAMGGGPGFMAGAGNALTQAGGVAGRGALWAGGQIGRAGVGALQGLGNIGGGAIAPFFGTPTWAPAPGTIGPQFPQNMGIWRSMVHGAGMGLDPNMLRYGSAAQLRQLGQENASERIANMGIGALGGAARLGADIGGSALMAGGLGAMGVGGALGFGLSMFSGGAIAAPATMAINEVMSQTAGIRGFGREYAREGFRFMPQSGSALRRPGMGQRQQFGQAMNRMAIEDLTYDQGDIQEIFSGASQQDLMRGVKSTQDLVQRMRETKELFKLMGRHLGQSLQEASATAGTLQGLGFDTRGMGMRAATFGATTVQGLTPQEVMQRSAAFARNFASQGLGPEMMGVGTLSQQQAQNAIQGGALSNRSIAAMGGREGAGQMMGELMGRYLEGKVGRSTLLAGATAPGQFDISRVEGLSVQDMMRRAGESAQDQARLKSIALGGEREAQAFLKYPARAQAVMIGQILDIAKTLNQGRPVTDDDIRIGAKTVFEDLTGQQLTGVVELVKNSPKAVAEMQKQEARQAAADVETQQKEATNPFARARRWWSRGLAPDAEGLSGAAASFMSTFSAASEELSRKISGTRIVEMGGRVRMRDIVALAGAGPEAEREIRDADLAMARLDTPAGAAVRTRLEQRGIESAKVDKATADKVARDAAGGIDMNPLAVDRATEDMKMATDPDTRRRAALTLLKSVYGDAYDRADPRTKKAMQQALNNAKGVDVGSALRGSLTPLARGLTKDEQTGLDRMRNRARSLLSLDDAKDVSGYANEEAVAYMKALGAPESEQKRSNVAAAKEAAIKADMSEDQLRKIAVLGTKNAAGLQELTKMFAGTGDELNPAAAFLEQGRGYGAGILEYARRQSSVTQIRDIEGTRLADVARKLGKGNLAAGLTGENPIEAIGNLFRTMTDENLKKLRGGEAGDRELAAIKAQLDQVSWEDGINEDEKKIMAGLLKSDVEAQTLIDNVTKGKVVDPYSALATGAVLATGGAGPGSMALGPQGLALEQAQRLKEVGAQMVEVANTLERIRQTLPD